MKTKTWLLLAGAIFVLGPRNVEASGACTAARFHDWQDCGCNQLFAGAGEPTVPPACADCVYGMPRWWVSEPYINLCMADTPLSYTTSSGQGMDFIFYYRQRTKLPDADEVTALPTMSSYDIYPTAVNCGTNASWANNWNLSITIWDPTWENSWTPGVGNTIRPPPWAPYSRGYQVFVWRPEGGINYFDVQNAQQNIFDPLSLMRLTSVTSGQNYPVVENATGTFPSYTINNVPTPDANGIYWGNSEAGLTLVYPDGSQDVFGLTPFFIEEYSMPNTYSTAGTSESRLLLTQRIDPQGRVTRLGYDYVTNAAPYYFRLHYVVDPDGRTNTFNYNSGFQISEIDDPYGRKASLGYSSSPPTSGLLNQITDGAGNGSSLDYQPGPQIAVTNQVTHQVYYIYGASSGWLTSLTTPYGTTRFCYYQVPDPNAHEPDCDSQRALFVSEPEGAYQLFDYEQFNSFISPTGIAPTNIPGQSFDDGNSGGTEYHPLQYRNTFHWGRRQFAAMSGNYYLNEGLGQALAYQVSDPSFSQSEFASALGALPQNDYNKAELKHWLLQGPDASGTYSITESLSSEQDPSPDAAGNIPGLRTWYNYTGKPSAELLGSDPQISCTARILPDGDSQYATYNYYPTTVFPGYPAGAGFVSNNISTYSKPDGTIGTLANTFTYATNSVDLISISNSAGQHVNLGYNGSHQITSITNALNQVATLSWNPNLTGVQWPGGQSVSLNYGSADNGRLQNISCSPSGRSFTVNSYSAGLPASVTDDRGLTVNNTWDNLNRLTGTSFPDGTTISNIYIFLDLGATKDRLGNWTQYSYDGLEHLTAITNANNAVWQFDWCGCGSLTGILDPLTNLTTLNYDNQGNLTNIVFPDFTSLTYQFDLAGRMTNAFDGAGRSLQVSYNNQGLPTAITGSYGTLQSATYDALNRPISVTDANGVTVANTFDAINELLTRTWLGGGGALAASESFGWSAAGLVAYTNADNQATHFGLDEAGRVTSVTNANHEVIQLGYDSLDDVISLVDGLQHQTTWQYNQYGWLTNKVDGLNRNAFRFAYNANGWVTNRWTPEKGNTGYAFDNVGNLKSIVYPQLTIAYSYNADNQLTNMVDGVGTTAFSYTPAGQLAGENGPWASDAVNYTYSQGLRTGMSIGSWRQSYNYDSIWRMNSITSPAGTFGYSFLNPSSSLLASISLPNGANIVNGFDGLARLTQTSLNNQWGHTLDGYSYGVDALGLRTNIVRNLGLTSSSVAVGFDNIGQITSWLAKETNDAARFNEQQGFGFDAADNLHLRTNNALVQTFTVDAANELTSVSRSGTFTFSGATPAPATNITVNGNAAQMYSDFTFARTNLTLLNGNNTFTNIAQNIYGLSVTNTFTVNLPSSVTLGFDNNGNLTNDGAKSLSYDSENQLTNVTVANNFRKDFVYDGLNRLRIKREYGWIGGTWVKTNETRYVWDGNDIVQLRDSNNVPTLTLTRGLDLSGSLQGAGGIGGLLAMTDGTGANYTYHNDAGGNVTSLMDASENIVARRMYDAFGRTINLTGGKTGINPFWFSSQLHDEAADIYSYLYRPYTPSIPARWLTRDPAGENGGINLYGTFANNPLRYVDPFGLQGNPIMGLGGSWNSNPYGGGGSFFGPGYLYQPSQQMLNEMQAMNDEREVANTFLDTFFNGTEEQQEANEKFHQDHPDLAFLADAIQLGASVEMGKGEVPCPGARGSLNPATLRAANLGSSLHADRPGNLPDQLRSMYPETEFKFTPPGKLGQDVEVTGGMHPSFYPYGNWPEGVNFGDFKPNTPTGYRTFNLDQQSKWNAPTTILTYDPSTGRLN